MSPSARLHPDGSLSIALRPCPTVTARELLDPAVPFVWVVGHLPHRVLEWWDLDVPLVRGEQPRRVRVRSLCCDLLLGVAEFREVAGQFDGGAFYQMTRPVPNTLIVERLPQEQERLYAILRQAGLSAHYYQPHSMEVAVYRTWDPAWMESLLAREDIADLVL